LHVGESSCSSKKRDGESIGGESNECPAYKKAKTFYSEISDKINLNVSLKKKSEVASNIQRPLSSEITKNESSCPSSKISSQKVSNFEQNKVTSFSECKKEKPMRNIAKPSLSKPSTSIFKSIEKLLNISHDSAKDTKQIATSVEPTSFTTNFNEISKEMKPNPLPLCFPHHAAQTQTLTTPTLSYEANTITRRPYEIFLDQQRIRLGAQLQNYSTNQNLLLLSSLVFSDQFCRTASIKKVDTVENNFGVFLQN